VLVFGVLLFLTQCTSRREGNRQLTEPKSWTTLQAAFPQLNSVPPMDTVANVLEKIPPGEVEAVLTGIIKRLLGNRRLDCYPRARQEAAISCVRAGSIMACPHLPSGK